MKNPYETLDINSDATDDEIKKKYRELAMIHHPDKKGDENVFKEVAEAYGILADPVKKKYYDENGTKDNSKDPKLRAYQIISGLVMKFTEEDNNMIDLIENIREDVDEQIQEYKDIRDDIEVAINVKKTIRDEMKKRNCLKNPGNFDNIILSTIEDAIKKLEAGLKLHNENNLIETTEIIFEIMDYYEYNIYDKYTTTKDGDLFIPLSGENLDEEMGSSLLDYFGK